jgi:hypothetical protein
VGSLALLLAIPALSNAEGESNPNDYTCHGHILVGRPEVGSTEQQVEYVFSCNGPITGYQLQTQVPLEGFASAPLLYDVKGATLPDAFSCSGEIPGYAVNCVGVAKLAFETVKGQFAIGTKLCVEPRVDPLLSVTYAYVEKSAVTQAISGPFDLGRPVGCPSSPFGGQSRLSSESVQAVAKGHGKRHKRHARKNASKKSAHRSQ